MDVKGQNKNKELQHVCGRCSLCIEGSAARFNNKWYHDVCFICSQCREPLKNKPVHVHDGKNYDEECYNLFYASRCSMCYGPILTGTKYTRCGRVVYHCECYSCCFCQRSLVGIHFIREGEKLICALCRDIGRNT